MNNMHLIGMQVKNFLKIENFDYQFDGQSVNLIGENGAGKTSLLIAILWACGGKKVSPLSPVRSGEKKAEVTIDLGDLIIKRSVTERGEQRLKVTNKEGMTPSSPQALLNKLIGAIAFDPHAFMQLDAKKQMEKAAKIAGVEETLKNFDVHLADATQERQWANRKVRDLKGSLAETTKPSDIGEEIDTRELEKKCSEASMMKRELEISDKDVERAISNVLVLAESIEEQDTKLRKLRDELEEAAAEQKQTRKIYDDLSKKVSKLPSTNDMEDRLEAAKESNKDIQKLKTRHELFDKQEKELEESEAEAKKLDSLVNDLRVSRQDAIKNANLPVDGIDFSDEGLIYNGHPFSQASHAEQIRVSTGILMAQNPKLRLIIIKDASLMDAKSWAVVKELSEKNDFQVLYEVVCSDPDIHSGLYIDDGALTHVDGKEVEAKEEVKPDDETKELPADGEDKWK